MIFHRTSQICERITVSFIHPSLCSADLVLFLTIKYWEGNIFLHLKTNRNQIQIISKYLKTHKKAKQFFKLSLSFHL